MKLAIGTKYQQINFNFANPLEHVPEAERNIRVIKEQVRAQYHRLHYQHLTRNMVKYMTMDATKKLNFIPARHGISQYYSPRMILHQQNLQYDHHGQHAIGKYVMGHDKPHITNTNAARALDCIYLRYNSSHQGGHELLHLPTNAVITRRFVTPIPITPAVMRQVHTIATTERMPPGLKIENKQGQLLYNSAWLAGVDYDQQQFNDDDDIYDDDFVQPEEDNKNNIDKLEDELDLNDIEEDRYFNRNNANSNDNDNDDNNNNDNNDNNEPEPPNNADDDSTIDNQSYDGSNNNDPDDPDDPDKPEPPTNCRATQIARELPSVTHAVTRSGRISKSGPRLTALQMYQFFDAEVKLRNLNAYDSTKARVILMVMCQIIKKHPTKYSFIQSYSVNKAIKKFGHRAKDAAFKEMKQLHDQIVFKPINLNDLTDLEQKRAMESLIFIVEKRDGSMKARTCANGSTQRAYIDRDQAASPTAASDAIVITGVVDAKQKRDVMTSDVPNVFVQTNVPSQKDTGEKADRIIMKIRGVLVDMLVEMDPTIYTDFVIEHNGNKVLYVQMLKAL